MPFGGLQRKGLQGKEELEGDTSAEGGGKCKINKEMCCRERNTGCRHTFVCHSDVRLN